MAPARSWQFSPDQSLPTWISRRPRFGPLAPWQRAQYLVVFTVVLAHIAFDLTQPFIPLYVRYLGVTDLAEASLWSGLIIGISPLCGAMMGPIWGSLADRFGRKPMVLRALVMISLMQLVQSVVPDVGWLLVARVVMGLFAGFTPMAMALAISLGPRERMGQAIGMVQAAQFLPLAFGPPLGGLLSDTFSLRANFMLTGVLLLVPAIFMFFLVQENVYDAPKERPAGKPVAARSALLGLVLLPGFAAALGILFMTRFADRTLTTILPLYLVELDTPGPQLATVTGLVVAAGSVAAAASSMLYGHLSRPGTTRRLLLVALAGGALCSAPLAFTSDWTQVLGLRVVLGLLTGGGMSLAYAAGARLAPAERSGLTLSVLGSCGQLGGAISPIAAGVLGQFSLRAVFLANVGVYLIGVVLAALVGRRGERSAPRERAR